MRKISLTVSTSVFVLFLLILFSCKPKGAREVSSTSQADSSLTSNAAEAKEIFVFDSISNAQEKAPSLRTICYLASKIMELKDSLRGVRQSPNLTDPNDSLVFSKIENLGYQAIIKYQQLLSTGIQFKGNMPSLVNSAPIKDTLSLRVLPKLTNSGFLVDKHFFFLGGGPFLYRVKSDDGNSTFKDPNGNPEILFSCNVNENTKFLFDAILNLKNTRINVTFGPPLHSYFWGTKDVKGIGSLNHEFAERIPVQFLTEDGIVAASLISIRHKLDPESLGCVSDNPEVVFACSTLIEKEILGIYIPYDSSFLNSCSVNRNGKLWTIDINNDGVPDLACVSDTFTGISSDNMASLIWYLNVNGEWKTIDHAQELDCT